MPSSPSEFTPDALHRCIVRWNFEQCIWGGAILLVSVFFWLLTGFASLVVIASLRMIPKLDWSTPIPWNTPDDVSLLFESLALSMLAGIGISSFPTLFVLESSDDRFAGIELPKWRWNDQWGTDHCWALLGIAPALTLLGIRVIQRCFSFDRSRINLACRTYAYLDRWDDWAPYPKLFSQRRAVQLLYHMKLIRVSHRFGKLEIRIRRNVSQKRSVIS